MSYSKRKSQYKRRKFISLDNPIGKRLLGKNIYQAYMERQGGDEDE